MCRGFVNIITVIYNCFVLLLYDNNNMIITVTNTNNTISAVSISFAYARRHNGISLRYT